MIPTLITVKSGKARPKNPYTNYDPIQHIGVSFDNSRKEHADFESTVQWHDCPEATEYGEYYGELIWQAWDGIGDLRNCQWFNCVYHHEEYERRGIDTRQIWRIVPQPQKKTMENRFEIENSGRQAFKFETEAHIKDIQNPDCTIIVQSGYTTLKETDEYTELILNILNETTRK